MVAWKGIFRRDLTRLILEHAILPPAGNGGWRLRIKDMAIPAGKFGIEVTISDRTGNTPDHKYFFKISSRI